VIGSVRSGTKNGRLSATRRFAPSCASTRSRKVAIVKRLEKEKQNGKATSNSAMPFPRAGEIAILANFTKSTSSFPPFFFCLFNLLRMVRLLHLGRLRERYVPSRNRRRDYVLGSQKGVINMLNTILGARLSWHSARALHPQLRPGGIPGPPGEDARLADQWVRVLPRPAFERRPRPRRDRAETLRARRVGGGALLLRARTGGARAC
jgi:hypothetical protein